MGKSKKKQKEHSPAPVAPLDYEKLAKCIAKAIAEENDKRTNAYSITSEWMKFIITPIFWIIIILSAILSIALSIVAISYLSSNNPITMLQGGLSFMAALFLGTIAIMTFFAIKEIDKEKDKQFVVSVFSGMISLVALIVALVALFMEVK